MDPEQGIEMKSFSRFRREILGLGSKILEYEDIYDTDTNEENDVKDVVVPIPGILSYHLYCFSVNFIF